MVSVSQDVPHFEELVAQRCRKEGVCVGAAEEDATPAALWTPTPSVTRPNTLSYRKGQSQSKPGK